MTRLLARLPAAAATSLVVLLLGVFIAYPIGAMLIDSFVISGPMPPARLAAIVSDALALLPQERRAAMLERWVKEASEADRVEALALAFRLAQREVPWDVKAAFAEQSAAASAALRRLDEAERAPIEAAYSLALAMQHKRVALAFQVRDKLSAEAFDRLRNGSETRLGLHHYLSVFTDRHIATAALNSLKLGGCACLFTVTLAFFLAYGINRGGVKLPGVARAITLMPLVSPPVLVAIATILLFGRLGLVTHGLLDRTLGLIDSDVTNLYGFYGIVAAQTLSFLPAAFIVLDNVLNKQDGRVEEAAAGLGASRLVIFRSVTVPLAWPGIKRAIVLVFILSLTDFGNPLLIGRDTPVIAGIIYDEITAFQNTALSAALCVWVLVPSLILYLLLETVGGRRRFATAEGTGAPELPLPIAWRAGLTGLAGCVTLLVVAIYAVIVAGAVTRVWAVDWRFTLGFFTATGIDGGWGGGTDRGLELVWESVQIAALAAPLGGLLALAIAYVVERVRPPGALAIGFLALVPAILPGIIFGVGYIIAFNLPFGIKALSLTGTSTILVINILFSKLYLGVMAARAALQRLDASVDEAAESLGAGLVYRFWHVAVPMLRPALLLGTLYVFVEGMTTLSSVIFLVSGEHKLASVAIFNHANSGELGYAAAKCVAILVLSAAAMALIWLIERADRTRHLRRATVSAQPSARASRAGKVPPPLLPGAATKAR